MIWQWHSSLHIGILVLKNEGRNEMNNKLLVEVSELMKKECDSILNAKTGEEMYESIDGILELLFYR